MGDQVFSNSWSSNENTEMVLADGDMGKERENEVAFKKNERLIVPERRGEKMINCSRLTLQKLGRPCAQLDREEGTPCCVLGIVLTVTVDDRLTRTAGSPSRDLTCNISRTQDRA